MKRTLTVNLAGTVFHIDEDAYRLLDNYLNNLKLHFCKQAGVEEIVTDIESRISELFAEKLLAGSQVITIVDVEEVIARMGKPEDFGDSPDNTSGEKQSAHTSSEQAKNHTFRRRWYRNPDDKMLGGVVSGLAAYFNWDVTACRLLLLLVLIFGVGTLIPVYLVCWIILPEAHTAAQKLNMRGEDVTIENIGKTVTDGFEKMASGMNNYMKSDKPRNLLQKMGDVLMSLVGFFLKACLVVVAVICSPILFVIILVFVVLVIAALAVAIGGGAMLYQMMPLVDWSPLMVASPMSTILGSIGGVILVGIPLVGIVYAILRQIFDWKPMLVGVKWSLFILWLLGLALFIIQLSALGWPSSLLIVG